jgi:hypothetical protein
MRWAVVIGSALVGLIIFLYLAVLIGGSVSGTEFSPHTFCRRHFYYFRLPIVQLQVTRTQVNSTAGILACSTSITSHMPGAVPQNVRWDLIQYSVSSRPFPEGDAAILMKYLDARESDGSYFWENWTNDNASLAKVLWPTIQQLAIHECYFAIPEIMEHALTKPTATDLSNLITKVSHQSAAIRAQAFVAEGEPRAASALLDWAISLGPSGVLSELKSQIPIEVADTPSDK